MSLKCFRNSNNNAHFYSQVFQVDKHLIEQFNERMIDLDLKNGAVNGIITCILCENDNANKKKKKKNAHSVRYHKSPSSNYWILSNFKKHLENMHNLVSIQSDLRTKTNRTKQLPLNVLKENNDLKDDKLMEYINVPIIDSQDENEEIENSIMHSTVELDCEKTIDAESDWLYSQLSTQILDMVGVVLRNGDITDNMKINIENPINTLTVAKIIGDGNCLPSAICHQLFHDPIGSMEHKRKTKDLRANVVDYILKPENFPSYEHTLKGRIYELKNRDEIIDMTTECKLFVRHGLSRDGCWAGYEFIVAASKIHHVNIFVFNENGDFYLSNSSDEIYSKTIALAFRLNYKKDGYNHYDSVGEIDSNLLYAVAEKVKLKPKLR